MKKLPLLLLVPLLSIFGVHLSHAAEPLVLAADGKSEYRIVIPDAATADSSVVDEGLQQTARLLSVAFEANGYDVAVERESEHDAETSAIFLGNTAFARNQGVDVTSFVGWQYVQRVVGENLILAGHDHASPDKEEAQSRRPKWDRVGTAKAVVDFLREHVGTRFLYQDISPYRSLTTASQIDLLASPAIEFLPLKAITVPGDLKVTKTPLLRFNTGHPAGGSFGDVALNRFPLVDDVAGAHTWERAVPKEKYAKSHPEYFALLGGERSGKTEGNGQYCISNSEVQELFYQDLASWFDRGYQTVGLGQPDGFRPCQCEKCDALFDTGDDWGEKIWILNRQLAERLMQSHPDGHITMISYIQTAEPPKTFKKFPANTRVMLTGTNEEDIQPWRGHEVPGGFDGYVYNWCPNLASRYTPMRTPLFVEEQVKRLAANRIQSLKRDGPGQMFGLEGPVYYTMGRMFDDPENLRAADLVREFCDASFGPASGVMKQFYDQLYHSIELYSIHLGTRSPAWTYHDIYGKRRKHLSDPFQLISFLYPPKLLADLERHLARAEELANTDKIKARTALVRREFDYVVHLARVVHLYHAFEIQADFISRERLLDAIDARNAEIDSYYDERERSVPVAGDWAFVMFPPGGHNAAHLRLFYDRYQEPFADTCLNWDTEKMRAAPLPGAQRMAVTKSEQDEEKNVAKEFSDEGPVTRVRASYDNEAVMFRIECADAGEKESLAVFLTPVPSSDKSYRFSFGPDGEKSKADAASGFITDAMDPRHGQFDPDWSGEWTVETKTDSASDSWSAVVRIPFQTLGVEAPKAGAFWRGNIGRVAAGSQSTWSKGAGSSRIDDRNSFGELVFGEPQN
jgi:hypothetical protein